MLLNAPKYSPLQYHPINFGVKWRKSNKVTPTQVNHQEISPKRIEIKKLFWTILDHIPCLSTGEETIKITALSDDILKTKKALCKKLQLSFDVSEEAKRVSKIKSSKDLQSILEADRKQLAIISVKELRDINNERLNFSESTMPELKLTPTIMSNLTKLKFLEDKERLIGNLLDLDLCEELDEEQILTKQIRANLIRDAKPYIINELITLMKIDNGTLNEPATKIKIPDEQKDKLLLDIDAILAPQGFKKASINLLVQNPSFRSDTSSSLLTGLQDPSPTPSSPQAGNSNSSLLLNLPSRGQTIERGYLDFIKSLGGCLLGRWAKKKPN